MPPKSKSKKVGRGEITQLKDKESRELGADNSKVGAWCF